MKQQDGQKVMTESVKKTAYVRNLPCCIRHPILFARHWREDSKNQLAELGIEVTTEGVDWDTAYTRAESEPLVWGWGAHTPMELYNIYHTMSETGLAEYSPYANETVDKYMDEALKSSDLEASYDLWKKAQWDGESGITQEGDIPWIWLCNIDHLYFVKDGLKVADQKIHPHGHGWSIVNNVDQWSWE